MRPCIVPVRPLVQPAICTLAPSSDNCYLAYPSPLPSPNSPYHNPSIPSSAPTSASGSSSSSPGDVILFDALSLSVTNIIQAHKSPLACVTLNSSGTLLATASDKGTVIRVFSVPNGDKVAQFRRGTYGARIFSIAFNPVSSLLCVSSDTETVHIFKLVRDAERERAKSSSSSASGRVEAARRAAQQSSYTNSNDDDDEDASQTGSIGRYNAAAGGGRAGSGTAGGGYDAYIDDKRSRGVGGSLRKSSLKFGRSLVGGIGGLLPGPVSELWDPQRDFAFLKLPTAGVKSVVALSGTGPNVMVLTSEGIYYSYLVDLENGGECTLQKSYKCVASGLQRCANAGLMLTGWLSLPLAMSHSLLDNDGGSTISQASD